MSTLLPTFFELFEDPMEMRLLQDYKVVCVADRIIILLLLKNYFNFS